MRKKETIKCIIRPDHGDEKSTFSILGKRDTRLEVITQAINWIRAMPIKWKSLTGARKKETRKRLSLGKKEEENECKIEDSNNLRSAVDVLPAVTDCTCARSSSNHSQ